MYISGIAQTGVLCYFPHSIRSYLNGMDFSDVCEIHLSISKPLCIYRTAGRFFINRSGESEMFTQNVKNALIITRTEFEKCLELVTGASVYAVGDDMADGYVTIKGGHRVGMCGSGIIRNGKIAAVKNISSLNFRLARECVGISDALMPYILSNGTVKSTLIISPPGAGKTTMLRDIARNLSYRKIRVCIVDERCEIAAMCGGVSVFDLGASCDVFSGIKKSKGMRMMLRSMSPEVIITDELGTKNDEKAVKHLLNCGVAVIASVHGASERHIAGFETEVILSRRNGAGTIESIKDVCSKGAKR